MHTIEEVPKEQPEDGDAGTLDELKSVVTE